MAKKRSILLNSGVFWVGSHIWRNNEHVMEFCHLVLKSL